MKKFFTSALVIAIAVGFSSCAVEKTTYKDGTALEWHKKKVQPLKTADVAAAMKADGQAPAAVVEETELGTQVHAEVAVTEAAAVAPVAVATAASKVASTKSTSVWNSPRMQEVQSRIEHSTPGSTAEYENSAASMVATSAAAPPPVARASS